MANTPVELGDSAEAMEAKETAHTVPAGYWVLFFGLIAFGIYYLWAYSPWGGGWTQEGEYEAAAQGGTALGTSITHTIAYTAIPALAIAALAVMLSRRRAPGK
jgi:hypothetical protein